MSEYYQQLEALGILPKGAHEKAKSQAFTNALLRVSDALRDSGAPSRVPGGRPLKLGGIYKGYSDDITGALDAQTKRALMLRKLQREEEQRKAVKQGFASMPKEMPTGQVTPVSDISAPWAHAAPPSLGVRSGGARTVTPVAAQPLASPLSEREKELQAAIRQETKDSNFQLGPPARSTSLMEDLASGYEQQPQQPAVSVPGYAGTFDRSETVFNPVTRTVETNPILRNLSPGMRHVVSTLAAGGYGKEALTHILSAASKTKKQEERKPYMVGKDQVVKYLTQKELDHLVINEIPIAPFRQSKILNPQELEQKQDLAQKSSTRINLSGGFSREIGKSGAEALMKKRDGAVNAVKSIDNIKRAQALLESGMITGSLAQWKITVGKFVRDNIGLDFAGDDIANSEAYISQLGREVATVIKEFGAGTGLSDADREYAAKIVGGDIALDKDSLKRILRISKQVNTKAIELYNREVNNLKPEHRDKLIWKNAIIEETKYKPVTPQIIAAAKEKLSENPNISRLDIRLHLLKKGYDPQGVFN